MSAPSPKAPDPAGWGAFLRHLDSTRVVGDPPEQDSCRWLDSGSVPDGPHPKDWALQARAPARSLVRDGSSPRWARVEITRPARAASTYARGLRWMPGPCRPGRSGRAYNANSPRPWRVGAKRTTWRTSKEPRYITSAGRCRPSRSTATPIQLAKVTSDVDRTYTRTVARLPTRTDSTRSARRMSALLQGD